MILTAEEHLLLEHDHFGSLKNGQMGNGKSDRLSLVKNPSSKKAYVFSDSMLCVGEARCGILQAKLKAGG